METIILFLILCAIAPNLAGLFFIGWIIIVIYSIIKAAKG
jgi:hypothetical protein